eukprot:g9770.t1
MEDRSFGHVAAWWNPKQAPASAASSPTQELLVDERIHEPRAVAEAAVEGVELKELESQEIFARHDDGDGYLSREELDRLKADTSLELDFDRLDADGDGLISQEELANAMDWDAIGPAVDEAQRASKDGDRIGTGLALAQLALDVGGLAGPARLGARAARGAVAARGAAGLGQVLKHTLKRKATDWATRRAREAQVKVSLTALAAALEMPKCRRLLSNHFNLPLDEPPFSLVASADARLHAILARQVYRPPGERRGLRASLMEVQGVSKPGEFWYTYVAGTEVLAERGTRLPDGVDLAVDLAIASGSTALAGARARDARRALAAELRHHGPCARVTGTGHSLGGAVLGKLLTELNGVHLFNPGGLPDLERSLQVSLSCDRAQVQVHRIAGDVISVGFLPEHQQNYSKTHGLEARPAHSLAHFLPADQQTRHCPRMKIMKNAAKKTMFTRFGARKVEDDEPAVSGLRRSLEVPAASPVEPELKPRLSRHEEAGRRSEGLPEALGDPSPSIPQSGAELAEYAAAELRLFPAVGALPAVEVDDGPGHQGTASMVSVLDFPGKTLTPWEGHRENGHGRGDFRSPRLPEVWPWRALLPERAARANGVHRMLGREHLRASC